jgi:hypothetical protein
MFERIFRAPNGDRTFSVSDGGGGDCGAIVDAAKIGSGVEKYFRVVGISVVVVVVVIIIGRLTYSGVEMRCCFSLNISLPHFLSFSLNLTPVLKTLEYCHSYNSSIVSVHK